MKKMENYLYIEAVNFLNSRYWHDSVLHEIRIIRTNSIDQAVLILDLITNEDASKSERCMLTFKDCYLINTKMYGGVQAISDGEMIYNASACINHSLIDQVIDSWKPTLDVENLIHFNFTLSSTDSEVDIVCKSVSQELVKH